MMPMQGSPDGKHFERFVRDVEPRLRRALVSAYGPVAGRDACRDALSWAWEHWERVVRMDNPAGYLYRVGQSAARRNGGTAPPAFDPPAHIDREDLWPELLPAIAALSEQQRTVVVLVHGYGYRQTEVAQILGITASTVHEHLVRGLDQLRLTLEVHS
jgi:RNA polymerase sigma-70 factor (ECF subfamily)